MTSATPLPSCRATCDAVFSLCVSYRTALYAAATRPHKEGVEYDHMHPLQRIADKDVASSKLSLVKNLSLATPADIRWIPPVYAACMFGRAANVTLIVRAVEAEGGADSLQHERLSTPIQAVCANEAGSLRGMVSDDATEEERLETLQLLFRLRPELSSRASLEAACAGMDPPLLLACMHRHNLIIHALLDAGVDHTITAPRPETNRREERCTYALAYLRKSSMRAQGDVQLDVLARLVQLPESGDFIAALDAARTSLPQVLVILSVYARMYCSEEQVVLNDRAVDVRALADAAVRALMPLPAAYQVMCTATRSLVGPFLHDHGLPVFDWWAQRGALEAWLTRADKRPVNAVTGHPEPVQLWSLLCVPLMVSENEMQALVRSHHVDAIRWPGFLQLLPRAYADFSYQRTYTEMMGYEDEEDSSIYSNRGLAQFRSIASNVIPLLRTCAIQRRLHALSARLQMLRTAAAAARQDR